MVAAWLGIDFLILGVAHVKGAHRVFGKRIDGTLPFWSWLLYLPLFVYTSCVWHVLRALSREKRCAVVTPDLKVGPTHKVSSCGTPGFKSPTTPTSRPVR